MYQVTTLVLDNGLLIDPQDQQLIAYALLKLFADKQLWAKSRANGLRDISILKYLQNKNLHFLVTYLFHVASSSMGATGDLKTVNLADCKGHRGDLDQSRSEYRMVNQKVVVRFKRVWTPDRSC
ncbi:Sucrose phosphate synthase [Artemisia annua]|uniref:Sucrose phosphate synthase n=1 Tax=Artemisia annua TaxID=35608 RepID=A0A2U1K9V4_ARTAN|nr:Sucrose phosphate synthase [Artemisia annua]